MDDMISIPKADLQMLAQIAMDESNDLLDRYAGVDEAKNDAALKLQGMAYYYLKVTG
jgi:hypothetical protein